MSFWNREPPNDRLTVPTSELVMFTRQICTMLDAGVSITAALNFYSSGNAESKLQPIIARVTQKVESGSMLSRAMQDYPRIFSSVFVGLVLAGEQSGHLDVMLNRLAELTEKQESFGKKLQAALTYPAMLVLTCLASIIFFMTVILPALVPMFEGMKLEMPLPTRILVGMAHIATHPATLVVGVLFLLFFFLVFLPRLRTALEQETKFSRAAHEWFLLLPLVGPTAQRATSSRLLFTLATLMDVGITLNASLKLCAQAAGNYHLAFQLREVQRELRDGESLYTALSKHPVFPNGAVQMIAVGEESAVSLPSLIRDVAQVYQDDAEMAINNMVSMAEPLIMGGMGVVCGFLIISTILPLVSLLKQL